MTIKASQKKLAKAATKMPASKQMKAHHAAEEKKRKKIVKKAEAFDRETDRVAADLFAKELNLPQNQSHT